ncbi:MAG: helix-turn-helix domain-containing protein [Actinomycetes bacterium]
MSIGQVLTAARQQAGLTIEQVGQRTRIRPTIIASIEADEFGPCGGDTYARGHVRAIAHVVGADADELVAEFNRSAAHLADPGSQEFFAAEASAARPQRHGPNWAGAAVLVLLLVIGYAAFSLLRGHGASTATTAAAGVTTGASPTPRVTATPQPSATAPSGSTAILPPGTVAQASPGAVTVTLSTPSGPSWISATTGSGRQLFAGLLSRGTSQTFTDGSAVRLVIGNAGAVDLVVNGKNIGTPGGMGQVVRLSFTPTSPSNG